MKKSRLWATVATAVGVIAGSLALAAPASAAPADCPTGASCNYEHYGFQVNNLIGPGYFNFNQYVSNMQGYGFTPDGYAVNDHIQAVYNNGQYQTCYWYVDAYEGGAYFYLPIHGYNSALASNAGPGYGFANQISSGYFSAFR